VVSGQPGPKGDVSISFSESPEVIQKEISQNGNPYGNGRGNFKGNRKEACECIKQAHIYQYARTSDNAEFDEFFELFSLNFDPFQDFIKIPGSLEWLNIVCKCMPAKCFTMPSFFYLEAASKSAT
jgi:hypothetical protein